MVLLTTAGLQVPVIPFEESAGNVGAVEPEQIVALAPKAKAGGTIGFTVKV